MNNLKQHHDNAIQRGSKLKAGHLTRLIVIKQYINKWKHLCKINLKIKLSGLQKKITDILLKLEIRSAFSRHFPAACHRLHRKQKQTPKKQEEENIGQNIFSVTLPNFRQFRMKRAHNLSTHGPQRNRGSPVYRPCV